MVTIRRCPPTTSTPERPARRRPSDATLPRAAGGLGALWSTLKHLRRDSGFARGAKALLAMNQAGGFDCPGCAWPEPQARRARAVRVLRERREGARRRSDDRARDPGAVRGATVDELRELSDFELGQLGRITHPLVLGADRRYHAIELGRTRSR